MEEAVIDAQLVKSTTRVSSTSVEDMKTPMDKNSEESQQTCKEEIPLTSDTKVLLSREPGSDAQLIKTTTLVLPTSVEEEQKLQLPIKDEIPINFSTENPSFQEAVTDTQLSSTSGQILSTVDRIKEEPQQSCEEEIPLTLDTKALVNLQPMSEAVTDTQLFSTSGQILSTVDRIKEEPQQSCEEEIPLTLDTKALVNLQPMSKAVTDTQLSSTSGQILSTVDKIKEEPQQFCKEEISLTLDTKALVNLQPMSEARLMNTGTLVLPTSVEYEEKPRLPIIKVGITVKSNAENPSFLEAVTDTQLFNTSCCVPSTVSENKVELQQTCKEELPFTLDTKPSLSHLTLVNNADLMQTTTWVSPVQVKVEPGESCRDELNVTDNKTGKQVVEIVPVPKKYVDVGTSCEDLLPFECRNCGKCFLNERILSIHQRFYTYNSSKPYSCKYCKMSFSDSNKLLRHVYRHTGERPYECSVCRKTFIDYSSCHVHMRIHTGEKPYECSVCSKRFTQPSNLSSHMKTHSRERPYQCDICQSRFMTLNMLTRHRNTHEMYKESTKE